MRNYNSEERVLQDSNQYVTLYVTHVTHFTLYMTFIGYNKCYKLCEQDIMCNEEEKRHSLQKKYM